MFQMRTLPVILAFFILSLSGCGTFSDAMCGPVGDNQVFYRGVRLDVEGVKEGGPMVLMAADIPFSAVADTLLVPYLAYHELTDPPRESLQSMRDKPAISDKPVVVAIPTSPLRPQSKWPASFDPEASKDEDHSPSGPSKWNVKESPSEERALKYVPLDEIPSRTPIAKAQAIMQKAGFKCWEQHDDIGQTYLYCSKYLERDKGWGSASLVSDEIQVSILFEGGVVTAVKAREKLLGP